MLNITNSLLAMTALFNVGLAVFILRGNWKNPVNFYFGIFLTTLSLWAISLIGYQSATTSSGAIYYGKAAYAFAMLIGAGLYLFSVTFPEENKPSKKTITAIIIISALFIGALFEPMFLIQKITVHEWGKEVTLGLMDYVIFAFIFCFLYMGGIVRIWGKYFKYEGTTKTQLLIIGVSVLITGIGGVYYNLILASPFVGNFAYLWSGPIFATSMAIMITYSVFRLRLFNAKVIATELLISLLWIFTFLRTMLASSAKEQILNGGLLILSLVIGSLLIKSVRREVRTREQIELLAKDLEKANEQLKVLDQQKSEFVSIASHQLRSPLTAIRGYTSMLMEGSYGDIPAKALEAIDRVSQSSQHLVALVEDLLNVSRIESGKMAYDFVSIDLEKTTEDIIGALLPNIQKNKLDFTFETDKKGSYMISADSEKIRQVILNLIDNSMKYTPSGFIKVHLSKDESAGQILLTVQDSGIGVSPELKERLFEKFSRGDDKTRLHVNGTGLGLYVAKEIIKAHKGNIWVESPGEGKGSTFFVQFEAEETRKEVLHNEKVADFAETL